MFSLYLLLIPRDLLFFRLQAIYRIRWSDLRKLFTHRQNTDCYASYKTSRIDWTNPTTPLNPRPWPGSEGFTTSFTHHLVSSHQFSIWCILLLFCQVCHKNIAFSQRSRSSALRVLLQWTFHKVLYSLLQNICKFCWCFS